MKQLWYVLGRGFTCGVTTTDGIITGTPPLLRKFNGQPLDNLRRWSAVESVQEIPT